MVFIDYLFIFNVSFITGFSFPTCKSTERQTVGLDQRLNSWNKTYKTRGQADTGQAGRGYIFFYQRVSAPYIQRRLCANRQSGENQVNLAPGFFLGHSSIPVLMTLRHKIPARDKQQSGVVRSCYRNSKIWQCDPYKHQIQSVRFAVALPHQPQPSPL